MLRNESSRGRKKIKWYTYPWRVRWVERPFFDEKRGITRNYRDGWVITARSNREWRFVLWAPTTGRRPQNEWESVGRLADIFLAAKVKKKKIILNGKATFTGVHRSTKLSASRSIWSCDSLADWSNPACFECWFNKPRWMYFFFFFLLPNNPLVHQSWLFVRLSVRKLAREADRIAAIDSFPSSLDEIHNFRLFITLVTLDSNGTNETESNELHWMLQLNLYAFFSGKYLAVGFQYDSKVATIICIAGNAFWWMQCKTTRNS